MSGPVVLLGPQRPEPNAPAVLDSIPGAGPVVVIAAGWRHNETDDAALRRHLGPDVAVLPLYAWYEIILRELPDVRAAVASRRDAMKRNQQLYEQRLGPALGAARALLAEEGDPAAKRWLDAALREIRAIDAELLAASDEVAASAGDPRHEGPTVARMCDRAARAIASARAVVITGGHVAVLRSRLAFFGVMDAIAAARAGGTPVIAWSAGAMVLTDRIVLFYDDPPEGPSFPQVLDRGFGLVDDLVALPHARLRLRLDSPPRVGLLARRLAPAPCLGLDNGAWLARRGGGWVNRGTPGSAVWLRPDGTVEPLPQVAS